MNLLSQQSPEHQPNADPMRDRYARIDTAVRLALTAVPEIEPATRPDVQRVDGKTAVTTGALIMNHHPAPASQADMAAEARRTIDAI